MKNRISIGIPSIVLIFMILCLSVFSLLSLSDAQTALSFSKRHAEAVRVYYQADAQCQTFLRDYRRQLAFDLADSEVVDGTYRRQLALDLADGVDGTYRQLAEPPRADSEDDDGTFRQLAEPCAGSRDVDGTYRHAAPGRSNGDGSKRFYTYSREELLSAAERASSSLPDGYALSISDSSIRCDVPLENGQMLRMETDILAEDILAYYVYNGQDYTIDTHMPVFGGD